MNADRGLLLAALALVVAVTGPLVLGRGVDLPDDALYYGVASWEWLAHASAQGLSPFWVPGKLGGVSLFADVVPMGPFYPACLLALVLPIVPAMGLAALLHAIGGLFAVRWLARLHGARSELATLAGAAVAAGPLAVWAALDFQVDAWPAFLWFPVTLGCLLQADAADREAGARRRWLAAGAGAVAMLLLGSHLRIGIAAGGALAAWALIRGRDLRGAATVGALGLIAGAPGTVPMLMEARAQGAGGAVAGLGSPPDLALGLWNVAGWLAPKAMLFDRDLGVGAVLGVGVIAAALLLRERRERRLLVLVAVLFVAGSRVPGARQALAPLTLLTHPVNLVYPALALIPAAVLGALGLQSLLRARRGAHRAPLLWIVGALAASVVLRLVLGRYAFPSGSSQALYALAAAQLALVAVGARAALRRSDPVPALVALALLDLAAFGARAHLAVPSGPLRPTSELRGDVALLEGGFLDIEDLAAGFDASLVTAQGPRPSRARRAERPQANEEEVVAYEQEAPAVQRRMLERTWPVHAGMATGTRGLAGRSKMAPARATALLAPVAEELADLRVESDVVAHVFGPRGIGRRALEVFGVERALRDQRVEAIVLAADRTPRCGAVTEVSLVEDAADRVARLLDVPLRDRPRLVEEPVDPALLRATPVRCAGPDADLHAWVDGPALVQVTLPPHPGWQVTIDGRLAPPLAIDQVHQAVRVPPGPAAIRWVFRPPGLTAALTAGLAGWLLLGLLAASRPPRGLAMLLVLLAAPAASAASIEGHVREAPAEGALEAWLVDSLDLTDPRQPVSRSPVEAGRFSLQVPEHAQGDGWVFLRQEVPRAAQRPLLYLRPASLTPFSLEAPPAAISVRAVPPELARRRDSGQAAPRWWGAPVLLALALFLGAPLARRRLLAGRRGLGVPPEQAAPRGDLAASAAPSGREAGLLAGIVAAGAALRLRGFGAPLDFLEWSYGPGTARIVPEGSEPEPWLDALLHPACLELVHPPLWHTAMSALWALSGQPWVLRIPSFVLSLATIVACWWLVRRVSARAGVFAAVGAALAAPAIEFGRDATPYAFLAFAAVASLCLLLRALRTGELRDHAAWLALLVLAFLSHYAAALFGGAQLAALVWLAARGRADRRWGGAASQALRVGPWIGAPAVAWAALHFANFSPVALDTRLYADTYPANPGFLPFVTDFATVGLGQAPSLRWAALPLAALIVVGLLDLARRDRPLALLLAGTVAAFAGGTVFFYANLVQSLDGQVFWGFRWVSWFLPAAIALAAIGLAEREGPGRLAAAVLGGAWLAGTVTTAWSPVHASTHPDYAGAAAVIAADLQDRDGLAALPMWGQRGPIRTALLAARPGALGTIHDTTAWVIDGRAVYLEAGEERLPFESGVVNSHLDRVWLVVADERMFGREKFSSAVARRGVAFADATMRRIRTVQLDHLELILYAPRPHQAPRTVDVSSLAALRWLEPNTSPCTDGEDDHVWRIHVRLPRTSSSPNVENGRVVLSLEDASWAGIVEGGPCVGAPPIVHIGR